MLETLLQEWFDKNKENLNQSQFWLYDPVAKLLRANLKLLNKWKDKQRGDPKKAYKATHNKTQPIKPEVVNKVKPRDNFEEIANKVGLDPVQYDPDHPFYLGGEKAINPKHKNSDDPAK